MNINNYIYPNKMNFKNFRKTVADTNITILPSLLNEEDWQHYCNYDTQIYQSVFDRLIELSFVTCLAYTYYLDGNEEIPISSYYLRSLYEAFPDEKNMKSIESQTTIERIRHSKILQKYITIERPGGFYFNPELNVCSKRCTLYRVTPLLKELAASFANNPDMYELDVSYFIGKKGPTPRDRSMRYVCSDGRILHDIHHLRFHLKKHPDVTYVFNNRVDHIIIKHCGGWKVRSFKEFDDNDNILSSIRSDLYPHKIAKTSQIRINRKALGTYVNELRFFRETERSDELEECMRMMKRTNDVHPVYEVDYYRSNYGRFYAMCSGIQRLSKETRSRIFSEYAELDIKCSIFSIYKNLAVKYKYKKETPQLDALVSDPKGYRMQFTEGGLDYETVKTILTAMAYGARCDAYNILAEVMNDPYFTCFHHSCLLDLVSRKHASALVDMIQSDNFMALYKEIRGLGKHIINKSRKKDCRNILVNALGNEMETTRKTPFGRKMAHLYQAWESIILDTLGRLNVDGNVLESTKYAIGLYLHDGIYIHKDIVKSVDNLPELASKASNWIYEQLGFRIEYDMKMAA